MKTLKSRIADFFQGWSSPDSVTQDSSLNQVLTQYPHGTEFLERRYGIKVGPEDRPLSLLDFCEKHSLASPQIVYMEIQLCLRTDTVRCLTPLEAKEWAGENTAVQILDVRESWEIKICKLPNSNVLSAQLLDEILHSWPKKTPILLYCHFGIRSLDAATFLADRGFTNVTALKGGIDAWAAEIDTSLARYESAWC